ncbi:MAG TPA: peptidoglycan DD-metalloendopeptidase family protein [Caulobacteraceae bacterium]|jgi:murein DD-endopeptidase MepM/ murein hydrolase activator NlpD|nr:peptidoglycan DD-metalloendopeptidase family protein [Caulobacteraceae bacterium]
MTAFYSRVALVALMASALAGCAIGSPEYPISDDAAPARPAAGGANIVAVNTLAQADPSHRDASADVVQAEQTTSPAPPPAAEVPPPSTPVSQAPLPPPQPEPPPIVEAPLGPSVQPPVNRRPGADNEPPPAPPPPSARAERESARALRAARVHAPPPPPPAKPQVAGRVENVHDDSHTVEVEKGDTVNTISDGLMTPKDDLIRANRLRKPYELEVGRSLKIPVHKVYLVQAGDSLYGIAHRFSTPVDVLSDINRLDAKSHLRPGQKIALPLLSKDTGPVEPPRESAAEQARAEEALPPSRHAKAPPPAEDLASASPPTRPDPYAEPSGPRPYESLSSRSPTRPTYAPPTRPAYPPPTSSLSETAPSVSDSQIQLAGRGRFVWPVRGDLLSAFGPKPGGQRNDGVDIAAPEHSPVRAAASGDVVYAGDQIPGFGNLVLIKHEGGWVTAYAHLSMSEVKIKEHVSQGAEIGQVGLTGGVDRPQLHFEIRYAPSPRDKARPIDPSLVLSNLADQ